MSIPKKRISQRPIRLPHVLLLVALAALLGIVFWRVILPRREAPPPAPPAPPPAVTEVPTPTPPAVAVPVPAPEAPPALSECEVLRGETRDFFSHLDQEEYIAVRRLPNGSEAYIANLVARLLANPPVVSGETDNLFTLLSNTVHFYRILKTNDVLLIKDILLNESDNIEPLLDLFHRWAVKSTECPDQGGGVRLPLPGIYEYAGFFVNTLGGRSYLFRRESRLRMLIRYYSILTLDRANNQTLNRHGIDIRPPLAALIDDMRGSQRLTRRDEYLARLTELQAKYQQQYGGAPQPARQM